MILPLFGALIFMLISFGKALYYYIDLTHVAAEGARIAAVSQVTMPNGQTSLKGYLCSQLGSGSELNTGSAAVDKAVVQVSYPASTENAGDPVTVGISTNYHWIPFFNLGSMSIQSSATMRIENPPAATGTTEITGGTCP